MGMNGALARLTGHFNLNSVPNLTDLELTKVDCISFSLTKHAYYFLNSNACHIYNFILIVLAQSTINTNRKYVQEIRFNCFITVPH